MTRRRSGGCRVRTVLAGLVLFISSLNAGATVIRDAYFGWNFVDFTENSGDPNSAALTALGAVLEIRVIRYEHDGGVRAIGIPPVGGILGMPDSNLGVPVAVPTFTTVPGGDGETTRTAGGTLPATLPIIWAPAGYFAGSPYPEIRIVEFDAYAPGTGAAMVFQAITPYTVALIPFGPDTELNSALAAPAGDIYAAAIGSPGNPIAGFTRVGPFPGDEIFVTFAAAALPLPTPFWLLGSGVAVMLALRRRSDPTVV